MASSDDEEQVLAQIIRNRRSEPKDLSLQLLEDITDDFSKEKFIGFGTFGEVYKGVLKNGPVVAIKKLIPSHCNEERFLDKFDAEFRAEVECLKLVKHRNIVRFIGYCSATKMYVMLYKGKHVEAEKHERLLCFEYVPNGSLRDHLKGKVLGNDWQKCYKVIKGICHGLDYLHTDRGIGHLDLKPDNVLLDAKLEPKITDFGLSRLFDDKSMIRTLNAAGTPGYMAPEIFLGKITKKADVYSLGVMIIELMTGSRDTPTIEKVLKIWSRKSSKLPGRKGLSEQARKQVYTCIEIALKCVEHEPNDRPTTSEIIDTFRRTEDQNLNFETVFTKDCPLLESIDIHPVKPWILLGLSSGTVKIFNYKTQGWLTSIELSDKPVHSVVFIECKKWIAAGDGHGFIFVYRYKKSRTKKKQERIVCEVVAQYEASIHAIRSLAVHKYKPYILSSAGSKIMLWNWERTECVQVFQWHSHIVTDVKFSPTNPNRFASASWDGTIVEWSIGCPTPEFTQGMPKSDPYPKRLCSIAYLTSYPTLLIEGSVDGTAKVWDMEGLRDTLHHERFVSVTAVCYHPELETILTGTKGGTVCLWPCAVNSGEVKYIFPCKEKLNFDLGCVRAIRSLEDKGRVLIAHDQGFSMIEIDGENLSS